MTRNRLVALSAFFVLALSPAFAAAQGPWGSSECYGYGSGRNSGYGYGYIRAVGYNAPPYFALHPPVYYSGQIVRRPYGSSPFAYPSTYERTAPTPPQPQMVVNPHVRPDAAPVAAETVDRGQKIENPYFVAK